MSLLLVLIVLLLLSLLLAWLGDREAACLLCLIVAGISILGILA